MKKKIEKSLTLNEGYFSGGGSENSIYPKAEAKESSWKGKREFLAELAIVEENQAKKKQFKGWSNCRCCKAKNGSAEYELQRFGITFVWPDGFTHYVKSHNIRPSLAFQMFIHAASAGE